MSQKILPKFWMPSYRGTKTYCQICNVKFQLLVKQQHQCKRCLRSVCQQCGPQRRTIYESDGSSSLHRACLVCIKQIDLIGKYHQQYKLCFGQDSQFVDDWINKLNKQRRDYESILNEYSQNITGVTNDNVIRFKRQSEQIFSDILESYNFSIRNFVKVMTEGVNPQIIEIKIKNVMIGVYARVKSLPYVVELIYLAVFFLCFANEAHSYFIITRLIEKIFPQYIRVKKMKKDNLLESSLKTILEMYRVSLTRVDRNQLQVVAQYLQSRFFLYILSFSINICSFPVSFFIIDEILKSGNYLPFYKGIAALIANCREQISSYQSFSQVQIPILRNVTLQKLKSCFVLFEKSDIKFEISNELFDSAQHRKLHEKYKQMETLYSKSEKSLAQKQKQLKDLATDLSKKNSQITQQKKKITQLQSDLLKMSEHLPQIVSILQMKQTSSILTQRNFQLQNKCSELEKKIQKDEKLRFKQDRYAKNWDKIEQSYVNQLATLKTKNQIMTIQIAAKQVDFNTSFIERKLNQKNIQIKLLNEQVRHLKADLEYYKLKILQKSFSLKNKGQNLLQYFSTKSAEDQAKKQQFVKHVQNSKQLVQNIKNQAEILKQQKSELNKRIQILTHKNHELEYKLKELDDISQILQDIPQEFNYEDSVEQLQRNIQKQTNFMRKKSLEDIKQKFEQCLKQLRFRMIDCRLKQQKIKNSPILKILDPKNYKKLQNFNEDNSSNLDTLMEHINLTGQVELDSINKKQCILM